MSNTYYLSDTGIWTSEEPLAVEFREPFDGHETETFDWVSESYLPDWAWYLSHAPHALPEGAAEYDCPICHELLEVFNDEDEIVLVDETRRDWATDMAGDYTIHLVKLDGQWNVVEFHERATMPPADHGSFANLLDAVNHANKLLLEEEVTARIKHTRFRIAE